MLKRAFPILVVLFAGCIVQSFYPFYTDKSKVALPQLNGTWDAVKVWGSTEDATNLAPWQLSDSQILVYAQKSEPAKVRVTFFKLGQQLFCDSVADNLGDDNKVPWYWAWHARPVHTVTRVETNGDLLVFKPLDLAWLTNGIAAGKISLTHVSRAEDDNWPLFTASPAAWEKFLAAHANDTNAFPDTHSYVLKRHTAIQKTESSKQ